MSERARSVIGQAEVIVGYHTYVELIQGLLTGKLVISTGMMQEVDRCRAAVTQGVEGRKVAVISSGDPGIYGMAGLVLELVQQLPADKRPAVDIIPGISAVNAAAAILGAPLMHDFAVISLSDLLTPWEQIVKRVEAAAQGDFVIALYNPKSTKRVKQILQVQTLLLQHKSHDTPVGIVTQAGREQERRIITTLAAFAQEEINMFSLVLIGNSQTYVQDGKMITPRGYGV